MLVLVAIATSSPAVAGGDPDAAKSIVAEHCTACHIVPGYPPRHERAAVNAPPFQTIADQPDVYTHDRLKAFLRKPHFPMKSFILSPSDIDNLIAFIDELRAD